MSALQCILYYRLPSFNYSPDNSNVQILKDNESKNPVETPKLNELSVIDQPIIPSKLSSTIDENKIYVPYALYCQLLDRV